jgi:hypothetical protein
MPIATSKRELPNHIYCPDCDSWFEGKGYTDDDGKTICPNCAELSGLQVCDECGKWRVVVDCDGSDYCLECADNNNFAECDNCHVWFDKNKLVDCGGDNYCTDCAEANDYSECACCNEWFSSDDLTDCDDDYYCERCMLRKGYTNCHHCDKVIGQDDQHEGADDNTYCDSCWGDRFLVCDDCGATIWAEDSFYRNNLTYCEGCDPGEESDDCDIPTDRVDDSRDDYDYSPRVFNGCGNTFNRIGRRAYGVEIETYYCAGYRDYEGKGAFGAKYDGSIRGKEFVSSVLSGDKGLDEIKQLCDFGARRDWSANRDCGLHVHFDMRDESTDGMKGIAYAMLSTYDVWASFVERSRHGGTYCHKHSIDLPYIFGIKDFADWTGRMEHGNRYQWFNFKAYDHHKTFEVRLHHGTCDALTICNWIRGLSVWIDWASKKGWKGVRDAMMCRDTTEKYEYIKQVWRDAGYADLADWFDSKVKEYSHDLVSC